MAGLLIPPWYSAEIPSQSSMLIATFIWGFTICIAVFNFAKGISQTHSTWQHSKRINVYICLIWLEWASSVSMSVVSWMSLHGMIEPSFWYFAGILIMWIFQVQCLMQIIVNRIALVSHDRVLVSRLKWTVMVSIGLINISGLIIWIPARLQISETWEHINSIWDRSEKCVFLVVDASLNAYFMYRVKSKLIANGLTKYTRLFNFNLFMVFISIALDVFLIGMMSLPDDVVYVQVHPFTYLSKLHIEMNYTALIRKLSKKPNRPQLGQVVMVDNGRGMPAAVQSWDLSGNTTITGGQRGSTGIDISAAEDMDAGQIRKVTDISVTSDMPS